MQGSFNTLVGLFNLVGLWTNARKKFIMVFHPCYESGTQSEAEDKWWLTVEGISYR